MKVLIFTQRIDENDPVMGFFCRWTEEFSKKFDSTTVICLGKGIHHLPSSIKVLSLGKEIKPSRLNYVLNFYRHIWRERNNYDAVFVHMNQEYVLLGGLLWKLLGKKVVMWRNHKMGNFLTNVAVFLSDRVCCTSPSSYTKKFKKTELMPVGVDERVFKKDPSIRKGERTIVSLGRVSPVKKIDILVESLFLLDGKGVSYRAHIYGDPTPADVSYYEKLQYRAQSLVAKGVLEFHHGIPNKEVPHIINSYDVFVNLTPAGSFDKTILEAMATEIITIFSNDFLGGNMFRELIVPQDDPQTLAERLKLALDNPASFERIQIEGREYVVKHHSLSLLATKLFGIFQELGMR
jgi:glycosyltransferase involved in cell wall biosynthesis